MSEINVGVALYTTCDGCGTSKVKYVATGHGTYKCTCSCHLKKRRDDDVRM